MFSPRFLGICCSIVTTAYHHQFYRCHANRQGIAVLGFKTQNVEVIHERYQKYHPDLIHSCEEYVGLDGSITKVLQVFSYYEQTQENNHGMQPDRGTMLRFLQSDSDNTSASCALPGLTFMDAAFASSSQPAYCDHWVSNVYSRTGFWKTLEDVLDFSPKVSDLQPFQFTNK